MKTLITFIFILLNVVAKAQKIDSIYVNLYTDSLKKGTYNYINVDGLMSNGKYIPLDSTKLLFTCADAAFKGNSLIIPLTFDKDKVTIKVQLKGNEKVAETFDVYIKKLEDPPLKTASEIMAEIKANSNKKKSRS